jgi:predicted O-methyltransferase YrrM
MTQWMARHLKFLSSLVPELRVGAVVVMDNLPAHKMASIAPMIHAVGASIISLQRFPLL